MPDLSILTARGPADLEEEERRRRRLNQLAKQAFGPDVRVAEPSRFEAFLQQALDAFQRPQPSADASLVDRLLPGFRQLATPTLPAAVETAAPELLQPAARIARGVSSPLGLVTLPIGGSPRLIAEGLLGAAAGATAGRELGGETGELIGGLGGGFAGPIATRAGPAVTRKIAQSSADLATEMGRTNVGNVLLPRSQQPVARPLIFERLTPQERKVLNAAGFEKINLDDARDMLYGPAQNAADLRPGNLISAEDTATIHRLEVEIDELRGLRQARGAERDPQLQQLLDRGLLRDFDFAQAKGRGDATTFRWKGKGLDEIAQEALPEHLSREPNASEILIDRLRAQRQGGRGLAPRNISLKRDRIDSILAKYVDFYADPKQLPQTSGPVAQAGFGGEFGPKQAARANAEAAERFMTQAPLTDVAATEADRIAAARIAARPPQSSAEVTVVSQPARRAVPVTVRGLSQEDIARLNAIPAAPPRETIPPNTLPGFLEPQPPTPQVIPGGPAAQLPLGIPRTSSERLAALEEEVARVRASLGKPPAPQESAEAALEREIAAARANLPPEPPRPPAGQPPSGTQPPQPPGGDRVQTVIDKITEFLRVAPAARQVTAAERRAAIGRGAQIGRARAEGLEDPLERSRAFLSGQSGQVTSQRAFEPLGVPLPGEGGELAKLTPTESARALGITDEDFTALHRRIAQKLPDEFTTKDGQIGLVRLLSGNVPTERHQRLLEQVFGPRLVPAIRAREPRIRRLWDVGFDAIALLPKAARSSWDMSAPLRQGVVYAVSLRPSNVRASLESAADMIRVGFTRGNAEKIATEIYLDTVDPMKNRWAAELYTPNAPRRLFLHDPRSGMVFSDKEEFYASRLAEQMPSLGGDLRDAIRSGRLTRVAASAAALPIRLAGSGIRRSELMYGTYLNQIRNKIATRTLDAWEQASLITRRPVAAEDVDELINGVNIVTGRGNLGKLEGTPVPKYLSGAFWSPRLAVSRFQALAKAGEGATADVFLRNRAGARARRELAKDMLAFVGAGTTILGALKAFNVADVEVDPRSTDFGKIRLGNTRLDFWGGFQSTARFVSQLTTAETKVLSGKRAGEIREGTPHVNPKTGKLVSGDPFAQRQNITLRFVRSKLAPGLPTLFWNEFTGETFLGEKLQEPSGLIGAETGPRVDVRTREMFEQFVPLLAVDIIEAAEEQGFQSIWWTTGAGSLGVGVQSFDSETNGRAKQPPGSPVFPIRR